ncbi:MAG: hypothetical protein J1E83_01720 [Lachnospiraceae bacterium]|nr:hypothetical protein [Lachnospiraceae bacterium]
MKRKCYFIFAAAVLMTGLLAGCGNEADGTATQGNLPIKETIQEKTEEVVSQATDIASPGILQEVDNYIENYMEQTEETAIVEPEVPTVQAPPESYYGYYRITEFCPSLSWSRGHRYDWFPEQEADMLLGRVIELGKNRLVTYDSLRHLGTRDGRVAFPGNYIIEEITIEEPEYSWELVDTDAIDRIYICDIEQIYGIEPYLDLIEGKISIQIAQPFGEQEYYVIPDGILMYSTLTCEYYYLEKLAEKPEQEPERVLSEEEKDEILQNLFGVYTITEFLPTKFYPAPDPVGDPYLPKEEADLMIGRKVTISEDLFVSYDNFRLPNSEIVNRAMDDFWLEQIEILSPDYRVEEKDRKELYGLRDDEMLREELLQDSYVEINVFPGYSVNGDGCLPQLYLLNDGRIMMYAMGEFFLLKKGID